MFLCGSTQMRLDESRLLEMALGFTGDRGIRLEKREDQTYTAFE